MPTNVNLGDVVIATSFADYEEVDGLRLPASLTTRIDDFTMAEYRLTEQTLNGETDDLAAPEATRNAAAPGGPAAVTAE